jgi:hypothetical protein
MNLFFIQVCMVSYVCVTLLIFIMLGVDLVTFIIEKLKSKYKNI